MRADHFTWVIIHHLTWARVHRLTCVINHHFIWVRVPRLTCVIIHHLTWVIIHTLNAESRLFCKYSLPPPRRLCSLLRPSVCREQDYVKICQAIFMKWNFLFLSVSVCVCSFFYICMCYVYVYGPQLSEIKMNEWMNETPYDDGQWQPLRKPVKFSGWSYWKWPIVIHFVFMLWASSVFCPLCNCFFCFDLICVCILICTIYCSTMFAWWIKIIT